MSRIVRYLGLGLAVALAIVAGWRIIATRVSDALATAHPRLALSWDARNPQARLGLANRELESGHFRQADRDARGLLRQSPLQADAFTVLARVALADGKTNEARRLFAIALRRGPRDQYARGWMIGDELQHGAYEAALRNVNVLFNIAPVHRANLIPLLGRVAAAQPAFASTLATFLAADGPDWRDAMLGDLLAHASIATVDRVFGALQAAHKLDDANAERWYARLQQNGRWGEAYSRWASRAAAGNELPLVYNGSFAQPITGIGFDWRTRGEPGITVERVPVGGPHADFAASVTFLRRRANDIGFGQTLLLAPGRYRMRFRAMAQDLQSDKGLQWTVRCVSGGPTLGASVNLGGTFDWETVTFDFAVPASACPAQLLTLVNPGAGGSGKIVSGELWFTGFEAVPLRSTN